MATSPPHTAPDSSGPKPVAVDDDVYAPDPQPLGSLGEVFAIGAPAPTKERLAWLLSVFLEGPQRGEIFAIADRSKSPRELWPRLSARHPYSNYYRWQILEILDSESEFEGPAHSPPVADRIRAAWPESFGELVSGADGSRSAMFRWSDHGLRIPTGGFLYDKGQGWRPAGTAKLPPCHGRIWYGFFDLVKAIQPYQP